MKNSDVSETKMDSTAKQEKTYSEDAVFVKKTTDEKPEHHKAHAQIFVDGLSILCFNPVEKQTEIVFLKEHHDPVEIIVFKADCQEVWRHNCPSDAKVQIEIKKSTPKDEGVCYEDPVVKDDEDFRWMPDFCEWYDIEKVTFRENAKDHLSAKLVLKDAIFYTKVKSKSRAVRKGSGEEHKERIGRVLGGNIICEPGDTGIVVGVTGIPDQHFSKANGPYFITVRAAPHNPQHDHFEVIYTDILDLPDPEYKLQFERHEREWNLCPDNDGNRVTEFACQTFGGGTGDPPNFP